MVSSFSLRASPYSSDTQGKQPFKNHLGPRVQKGLKHFALTFWKWLLGSSFLTNQLNNRSDIRTTGDLLSWSVSSNFRPLTRDTMRNCFRITLFKQGESPLSFITLSSFCSSNTAKMLSTIPSLRVWGIWCWFFVWFLFGLLVFCFVLFLFCLQRMHNNSSISAF